MAGRKGVFFDTSTWSPIDLLDFYRQVAAGAGRLRLGLPVRAAAGVALIALRTARLAGLRRGAAPRLMLGGNATRSPTARELPEPTRPIGTRDLLAADAARADPPVPLDGDAAPLDAAGRHGRRARARAERLRRARTATAEEVDRSASCSSAARDVARLPERETSPSGADATRSTFRLIHLADIVAVTAGA